jgi:retron-type reverse transcriptase
MQLFLGGHTAIAINGEIGPYFRNKRGVWQGDPISPLLLYIKVDALRAVWLNPIRKDITGVIPHLIPGGITHFQYANDTMIIM